MHILVIASFYPSPVRTQTGIFFKEQVAALRKAGHQVGVIVAPRLWETVGYIRTNGKLPNLKTSVDEGDGVYRMHWGWFPRVFPLICATLHGSAGIRAFDRYVQEQGMPDLIHAHNIFYAGYMAVRIADRHNLPVVLTEHSTNYLRGRIFLPGQHIIVRYTLDRLNASFAVGQRLANKLNERYTPNKAVDVLHNIVDTDFFDQVDSDDVFTFVALGQMKPRKRFHLLIEAFSQSFRERNARLIIGGDGPDYSRLVDLAESLGVSEQVELPGLLNREQVRDIIQTSHVVVSSSIIETFGVTLIESMSCGKPVIATRSGGPEDFVTPEVGILIPTDDVTALADAMKTIFDNYEQYDAKAIRAYCINNFSEESIVEQLDSIYRHVTHTTP